MIPSPDQNRAQQVSKLTLAAEILWMLPEIVSSTCGHSSLLFHIQGQINLLCRNSNVSFFPASISATNCFQFNLINFSPSFQVIEIFVHRDSAPSFLLKGNTEGLATGHVG